MSARSPMVEAVDCKSIKCWFESGRADFSYLVFTIRYIKVYISAHSSGVEQGIVAPKVAGSNPAEPIE